MVDRGQLIGAALFLLLVVAWRDPGGEQSALGAQGGPAGAE